MLRLYVNFRTLPRGKGKPGKPGKPSDSSEKEIKAKVALKKRDEFVCVSGVEMKTQLDGRAMVKLSSSEARKVESVLKETKTPVVEVTELVEVPIELIPESARHDHGAKDGSKEVCATITLGKVCLEPVSYYAIRSDQPTLTMIARAPTLKNLADELEEHGIPSCLHIIKVKSKSEIKAKARTEAAIRTEIKAEIRAKSGVRIRTEVKAEIRAEVKAEIKAEEKAKKGKAK